MFLPFDMAIPIWEFYSKDRLHSRKVRVYRHKDCQCSITFTNEKMGIILMLNNLMYIKVN